MPYKPHTFPDFLVKKNEKEIFIVETKGREDLDDIRKVKRLAQWCQDVNVLQDRFVYKTLYIKQEDWDKWANQIRDFYDMENYFLFE